MTLPLHKRTPAQALEADYQTLISKDQMSLGFMIVPADKAFPTSPDPRSRHRRGESLQGQIVFSLEDLPIGKSFVTPEGNILRRQDPSTFILSHALDSSLACAIRTDDVEQVPALAFGVSDVQNAHLEIGREPVPRVDRSSDEDDIDDGSPEKDFPVPSFPPSKASPTFAPPPPPNAVLNDEVSLLTDPLLLATRGATVINAATGALLQISSQSDLVIGQEYLSQSGGLRLVKKPTGLQITPASNAKPSPGTRRHADNRSPTKTDRPTIPNDVPPLPDLQSMLPGQRRREMRYSTVYQTSGPSSVECAIESTDPDTSHLCPLVVDVRVEDSNQEIVTVAPSCLNIRWEASLDPQQQEKSFEFLSQSESRLFYPSLIHVDTWIRAVVEVQSQTQRSSISQPTTAMKIQLDKEVRAEVEAALASRSAVFKLLCGDERLRDAQVNLVVANYLICLRSRFHAPHVSCRLDDQVYCILDSRDPRCFFLFFPGDNRPYRLQAASVYARDVTVLTIQSMIDSLSESLRTS